MHHFRPFYLQMLYTALPAPCTLWFIHVQGSSNIVTDKKGQKAAPGRAARH
jgi:hypothetical protein